MSTDTNGKQSYWQREPARLVGQVTALLGLLAACGLQLSDETVSAITSLAGAVAALAGFYFVREKVTSPVTAAELEQQRDTAQAQAANPPAVMTPQMLQSYAKGVEQAARAEYGNATFGAQFPDPRQAGTAPAAEVPYRVHGRFAKRPDSNGTA